MWTRYALQREAEYLHVGLGGRPRRAQRSPAAGTLAEKVVSWREYLAGPASPAEDWVTA